jgi:hypothetical protein
MKTAEEITVQVRAGFASAAGQFRPGAFFDERLDCIRVITRDCSVMETRINEYITILEPNYARENDPAPYVGFTIKGARLFCDETGLSLDAPIRVSELLHAILRFFPDALMEAFVNGVLRPLLKTGQIEEVEVAESPGPELQLA